MLRAGCWEGPTSSLSEAELACEEETERERAMTGRGEKESHGYNYFSTRSADEAVLGRGEVVALCVQVFFLESL